jgi:hypothetical protein
MDVFIDVSFEGFFFIFSENGNDTRVQSNNI